MEFSLLGLAAPLPAGAAGWGRPGLAGLRPDLPDAALWSVLSPGLSELFDRRGMAQGHRPPGQGLATDQEFLAHQVRQQNPRGHADLRDVLRNATIIPQKGFC